MLKRNATQLGAIALNRRSEKIAVVFETNKKRKKEYKKYPGKEEENEQNFISQNK
jgi:hypothetical protein